MGNKRNEPPADQPAEDDAAFEVDRRLITYLEEAPKRPRTHRVRTSTESSKDR
jgi:hypothetical protein